MINFIKLAALGAAGALGYSQLKDEPASAGGISGAGYGLAVAAGLVSFIAISKVVK